MDHQDTFVSNQPAIKYPNILGIEALFLGFLFSPYGIPMLGASIIAFLHVVNKGIKSI